MKPRARPRTRRRSFWTNSTCTKISQEKYNRHRLLHSPLQENRKFNPKTVHVVLAADHTSNTCQAKPYIPAYIHWYVARGSGHADPPSEPSVRQLHRLLAQAHNNATLDAHFSTDNRRYDTIYRKARCKSSWRPPRHQPTDRQFRLAAEEFYRRSDAHADRPVRGDFLTRHAERWLREQPELAVADTDKNLGDIIISRQLLMALTQHQLDRGFSPVSSAEARRILDNTGAATEQLAVRSANADIIKSKQMEYLVRGSKQLNTGKFRIRVKLHKTPIAGRALCNVKNCTAEHISTFLHETLQPHTRRFSSVLHSSEQLTAELDDITIPPGHELRTSDIKDMFTSIHRTEMMPILDALFAEFLPEPLSRLCLQLLQLVISGTIIEHAGRFWQANSGLPTGLAVSCTVANILLVALDRHLHEALQDKLFWLRRYLDDLLTIDCSEDSAFTDAANSWMSGIELELTGRGQVYLDLTIMRIACDRVGYRLFEKPLNQYLYLPWCSAHPRHVKINIISAGLVRIHRRLSKGSSARDVGIACQKFLHRLRARGYPASALRVALSRTRPRARAVQIRRCRVPMHSRSLPLVHAMRNTKVHATWATPRAMFIRHWSRTWQPENQGRGGRFEKNFRVA